MPATIATARDFRSPKATLIRGHQGLFKQDKLGFFEGAAREYGDYVPLRFGPLRVWLVSDPAAIAEVLTTRAARPFGPRAGPSTPPPSSRPRPGPPKPAASSRRAASSTARSRR